MSIRNLSRFLQLIGLLLILVPLAQPIQAQEPEADNGTTPAFDPRFGIVDSFLNTSEANAAKAGWGRIFLRWDVIQPGGPSDWKPANVPDDLLNAEVGAGREIAAVLIGTPAWAAQTENGDSTSVPSLEYWGDFVFKVATQYKGRIKHWIIWHQPDVTDPNSSNFTWNGTEEDYYQLLKVAYQRIKAVDPEMQVRVAGLTYSWDRDRGQSQYLARLLEIISADPEAATQNHFFDGIGYQLYYDPRQFPAMLNQIHQILEQYQQNHKSIWIYETNAPPSADYLEPLQGQAQYFVTLEEQSAFVIQAFALALAGGAERIAFNKMRNDKTHPESVEPYGMLRGDNSRRPVFYAFQTVTSHFTDVQNATFTQRGDVLMVTLDRGGRTTTVLWNMGRNPTTFSLSAIAPEALLVDEQNNSQAIPATNGQFTLELPGAMCSNGQNCFIGGAPRLVVEAGSPSLRPALPATAPTATLPLSESQATATSLPPTVAPPTSTPTPASLPTLTPTALISSEQMPSNPITATDSTTSTVPNSAPTATSPISAQPTPAAAQMPASAEEAPPPAPVLPDPGIGAANDGNTLPPDSALAAPTEVPPISVFTILTPSRILWLFLIGLFVFTASYGIQVVIWYRLRR